MKILRHHQIQKKIIFHQEFLLNTYLVGNAQSKWFVHQYFAGVTSITTTMTTTATMASTTTMTTTTTTTTTKPTTTTPALITTTTSTTPTMSTTNSSAGIFHILTTIASCNKLRIKKI